MRLVIREALVSPGRLDRLVRRFQRGHVPLLLELVEDGVAAGLFRDDLPQGLLLVVVAALGGPAQVVLGALQGHLPGPLLPRPEGSRRRPRRRFAPRDRRQGGQRRGLMVGPQSLLRNPLVDPMRPAYPWANSELGMRPLLLALVLMSGACATGYHPRGPGGGYSELRVNERSWQVRFTGNRYTSPERAATMALRRAAELTAWSGYYGFWIADDQSYSQTTTRHSPDQCHTTGTADTYGNISADTTCKPGSTRVTSRPRANMLISMVSLEEAQKAPPGFIVYNARLILAQSPQ